MRILTVDDDPYFLAIIKSELISLGYSNIEQAASARDAIRSVRGAPCPFGLFLLDINMPGIDGVELCSMLRAEPLAKDIPIVMVTVHAELSQVDRAFAAGATDYLNKPLNSRELRGRLQMAERLTRERPDLMPASGLLAGQADPKISDGLLLEDVPACIGFLAMQNYLLKLGSMRMFTKLAVGVHVENVEDLFAAKDHLGFRDTMSDVAEIISEAMGTGTKLISYAGDGNFVVVLNRIAGYDEDEIADALGMQLSCLSDWYCQLGDLVPRLRLGQPVSRSLLSLSSPEDILMHAIDSARVDGRPVACQTGFADKEPAAHETYA